MPAADLMEEGNIFQNPHTEIRLNLLPPDLIDARKIWPYMRQIDHHVWIVPDLEGESTTVSIPNTAARSKITFPCLAF